MRKNLVVEIADLSEQMVFIVSWKSLHHKEPLPYFSVNSIESQVTYVVKMNMRSNTEMHKILSRIR